MRIIEYNFGRPEDYERHEQVEHLHIHRHEHEHEHEHDHEHGHAYEEVHEHKHWPGYEEYVEKHGYHFTEELAEEASEMMHNASGDRHSWKAEQVEKALAGMGHKVPPHVTLGDLTYLANMFYADLYPEVLESEAECLKAAMKMAHDPDGYKGMAFCRWKTDIKHKEVKIDFEEFV